MLQYRTKGEDKAALKFFHMMCVLQVKDSYKVTKNNQKTIISIKLNTKYQSMSNSQIDLLSFWQREYMGEIVLRPWVIQMFTCIRLGPD